MEFFKECFNLNLNLNDAKEFGSEILGFIREALIALCPPTRDWNHHDHSDHSDMEMDDIVLNVVVSSDDSGWDPLY